MLLDPFEIGLAARENGRQADDENERTLGTADRTGRKMEIHKKQL